MDKTFGKYIVTKKLGSGAMGIVYLGYDKYLERPVAIKTISSAMREEELKPRFIREAQSTANLHHNNIVTIYDFGVEAEQLYIVMEYLPGQDLDELIAAKKPLDIKDKLEIVRQICLGLDYAHRSGVLHRDIKPANIRVLEDGTVKILDFGLAVLNNNDASLTQSNAVVGTPHYIAPERILGEKAGIQSDQFSVGLILYEILTYRRPFTGDTINNIIFNILNTQPKRLDPEIIKNFPGIELIIKKSIAKNQVQRYSSMKEMAADIADLQQKMIKQDFSMDAPINVMDDVMSTSAEKNISNETYDEPTFQLSVVKTKLWNLRKSPILVLPILVLLIIALYFLIVPKSKPGDQKMSGASVPGTITGKEGYLTFDIKPYAVIDEIVNLESQQAVEISKDYKLTPVKLALQPGKYRIVYSNPQWKENKKTKNVTVISGDNVFVEGRVEKNFIYDAVKNFAPLKTKPAIETSTLTATVDTADLSPAEKLIDSGKQLVNEGKLKEAKEKFTGVLKLETGHQAAIYELNSLAGKYLDKGIENYFKGQVLKSEGFFREAAQILSLEKVAEKYSKNLVIAYQFLAVILIEKHYLGNDNEGNALDEAKSYIKLISGINPGFELDKKYFSPKVIDIFSK
ncbi:MAG: serine/threonine protein kinase [Acidobacteria bacterium]|jgi:serine/threonine protein kinase|nr:serine/threonine protein kinase [Acidobacteriota bacterium]